MVACSVLIVGHLPVLVMQQFLEYGSFPGTVLQASLHCYPVAVAQPIWGEVMIYIIYAVECWSFIFGSGNRTSCGSPIWCFGSSLFCLVLVFFFEGLVVSASAGYVESRSLFFKFAFGACHYFLA